MFLGYDSCTSISGFCTSSYFCLEHSQRSTYLSHLNLYPNVSFLVRPPLISLFLLKHVLHIQSIAFIVFYFKKKYFFSTFIYFFGDRERQSMSGGGPERGRPRIGSRLQAPSCQHRARRGARTHGPRDRDLSRSWTLNRPSHPGALTF